MKEGVKKAFKKKALLQAKSKLQTEREELGSLQEDAQAAEVRIRTSPPSPSQLHLGKA